MFYGTRFLTVEDRRNIKRNLEKERMTKEYLAGAVKRMQPRASNRKFRSYGE